MGLRQERLADEVRDVLANCFLGGKLSDPRLESVTITAVKLSADLQIAYVYYRVYDDSQVDAAQKGLESASGFLKREVSKSLELRRIPDLKFFFDKSVEHASKIEEMLNKL